MISSLCAVALTAQADEYPLTPHTAEYQVNYGSIELGKARYQLPAPQGNLYQYRFDSDVSLLMLWDKRTVTSTFSREGEQLIPMRYNHNRSGTGSDYQEQSAYVLDQELVHSRYKDERAKFPYTTDLFDPLMVQLQFRLDIMKGSDKLHYKMLKSGEIDEYDFKIVSKERMVISSGTYETVKIEVVRDNDKRQTFFWMSPELGYLPVRLTHFEKGSKQLDITLLNYHYSAPAMAQNNEQATEQPKVSADKQAQIQP
ncbi:DUF3108 domain-containing protein [Shewanella insulae]|uniref:DUF3108 domain-containing protein n=1 Tax=Shewanella insulae TaxID=2681496 RepID=UPI001EFED459|nr:DUF3108 domain-containing protein [Shewanella insulae]MCG9736804.1 DUF3108 domain-containing protein [Shewanella insulae]